VFAPLPLAVTDLLAAEAEPRQFPAGAVVMREGEPGDRFYLITDGAAAVSVHGAPKPSLRRGDCFGEIALLRGIPRTATITAERSLHTLTLSGRARKFAGGGSGCQGVGLDFIVGVDAVQQVV
jgi:CRP-like cAMP-binding protein